MIFTSPNLAPVSEGNSLQQVLDSLPYGKQKRRKHPNCLLVGKKADFAPPPKPLHPSEEDARHPLLSLPWRLNLWVSAMRCVGAGGLCDRAVAASVQILTFFYLPLRAEKTIKSGAVDMEGCFYGGWNVHISIHPVSIGAQAASVTGRNVSGAIWWSFLCLSYSR